MGYTLGLSQQKAVADNISLQYQFMNYGKYYWDNKKYNDHSTRLTLSGIYRTADHETTLSPHFIYRTFGQKKYSTGIGMQTNHHRSINPLWQTNIQLQLIQLKHPNRPHLDGTDTTLSNTWIRRFYNQPHNYVYGGVDISHDTAKDDSDVSWQVGLRFGIQETWRGFFANINGGIAQRQYQGADIFQIKRKDKIYHGEVSLWKDTWRWKSFVPKLTLSYERHDSNHFMYDKEGTQVFIQIHQSQ